MCVGRQLERMNSHRLGVRYSNSFSAQGEIFALAYPTVYIANGQLKQTEQNVLAKKIAAALRENLNVIHDKIKFEKDMYEMINGRTYVETNVVPDPYYNMVTDQMISIFHSAFSKAF